MDYVDQDALHTNLIEWNFGGTKMSLEGLPGSVVSILCGMAPPCLEDIFGDAWEDPEGEDPSRDPPGDYMEVVKDWGRLARHQICH
jgi:hypothetical protein